MTDTTTDSAQGTAADGSYMAGASASTIAADPSRSWLRQLDAPAGADLAAAEAEQARFDAADDADFERQWSAAMGEEPAHEAAERPHVDDVQPDTVSHAASTIAMLDAAEFPHDQVRAVLHWIETPPAQSPGQLAQLDASGRAAAAAELADLWGAEHFATNVRAINDFINTMPKGVAWVIRNGRDADGNAMANNPAVLQRLLGLARNAPSGPASSDEPAAVVREAQALMRSDRARYDRDERLQAAYREALTALHGA